MLVMPDNIYIPDEWIDKLNLIKSKDINAMIAGGAIRDQFFNVAPKDVDIFTSVMPDIQLNTSTKDYQGMQYVKAIGELIDKGVSYNYICIEPTDKLNLLQSFDFGFCQIGFDGDSILKTQEFLWDAKHNQITLRKIDRYVRSLKRYARINQRYNLDLIIPELETLNAKFS